MTPSITRSRRRRGATITLVSAGLAGALGVLAVGGAAGAAAPEQIPGDHQSPVVVDLASEALDALNALNATPVSGFGAGHDLRASREMRYRELLAATAEVTAEQIGADGRELQLDWLAADEEHQFALLTGLSLLGAPYRSISSDPVEGFDCSGFTSYVWGKAGVELPRQSGDQIAAAEARTAETVMAGDLVQYPGHVMLSLGVPGAVVHASNEENDVELWVASEGRADDLRYGDPTEAG